MFLYATLFRSASFVSFRHSTAIRLRIAAPDTYPPTLLNGRRLANEPLQDQYVSVNVIPRMALDRVETLSGGAASIYGADAIGGVQNFWTKRGYKGLSLKGEFAAPPII